MNWKLWNGYKFCKEYAFGTRYCMHYIAIKDLQALLKFEEKYSIHNMHTRYSSLLDEFKKLNTKNRYVIIYSKVHLNKSIQPYHNILFAANSKDAINDKFKKIIQEPMYQPELLHIQDNLTNK